MERPPVRGAAGTACGSALFEGQTEVLHDAAVHGGEELKERREDAEHAPDELPELLVERELQVVDDGGVGVGRALTHEVRDNGTGGE